MLEEQMQFSKVVKFISRLLDWVLVSLAILLPLVFAAFGWWVMISDDRHRAARATFMTLPFAAGAVTYLWIKRRGRTKKPPLV
jgi:hypothetical protein